MYSVSYSEPLAVAAAKSSRVWWTQASATAVKPCQNPATATIARPTVHGYSTHQHQHQQQHRASIADVGVSPGFQAAVSLSAGSPHRSRQSENQSGVGLGWRQRPRMETGRGGYRCRLLDPCRRAALRTIGPAARGQRSRQTHSPSVPPRAPLAIPLVHATTASHPGIAPAVRRCGTRRMAASPA